MSRIYYFIALLIIIAACGQNKLEKKGFQVNEIIETEEGEKVVGLPIDSLQFRSRPRGVLMTKHSSHRLTPIYKINYDKEGKPYSGSNQYRSNWNYDRSEGNNWNRNYMPGFEALYGYNLINISHYDHSTQKQNEFFEKPVLIKNLYFPAFSKDTLNYQPVVRHYYMVSVYNEDTNKDGFINVNDLRRFLLFDLNGKFQSALVPENYYVLSSEYDSDNDFMYITAKVDSNSNGQIEEAEEMHIFWIDLKNPLNNGLLFD